MLSELNNHPISVVAVLFRSDICVCDYDTVSTALDFLSRNFRIDTRTFLWGTAFCVNSMRACAFYLFLRVLCKLCENGQC